MAMYHFSCALSIVSVGGLLYIFVYMVLTTLSTIIFANKGSARGGCVGCIRFGIAGSTLRGTISLSVRARSSSERASYVAALTCLNTGCNNSFAGCGCDSVASFTSGVGGNRAIRGLAGSVGCFGCCSRTCNTTLSKVINSCRGRASGNARGSCNLY